MAEAELRREAEKLFQDMGLTDLPSDTLDFFQRNLENESSPGSDWKSGLKKPSSRPSRTNSEGTSLVHLKKKYSTGLNPDYHSKRNAVIAAVTLKSDSTGDSKNPSAQKLQNRKLSPAGDLRTRFGYTRASTNSAPAPKVSTSTAESSKPSEEVINTKSSASATKEAEQQSMLKRRSLRSTAVVASADGQSPPNKKLVHTSSAGFLRQPKSTPLAKTSSSGNVLNRAGPANHDSRGHSSSNSPAKRTESSAAVVNGVHRPMQTSGAQVPTSEHEHSSTSPVTTTSNTTAYSNSSNTHGLANVHNSIDSVKLSGINMRSLTKSVERKTSVERKVSDSESKPSLIPVPAQAVSGNVSKPLVADDPSSNNTQVVYSRKSSFKVLNMSSSSHRIMHTVQDGGEPKRQNSINRGVRPIPIVMGSSSSSQQNMAVSLLPTRQASESLVSSVPRLHHRPAPPPPPSSKSGLESVGYDSPLSHSVSAVNGESEPHNTTAKSTSQNQKKGGLYDRLSAPMGNSTAKKEEPVYETIKDGTHKDLPSPKSTKEEKSAVNASHSVRKVSGSSQKFPGSINSGTNEEKEWYNTDVMNLSGSNSSVNPVTDRSRTSQPHKHVRIAGAHGSAARHSRENSWHLGDRHLEGDSMAERPTSPVQRYSTESGALYTAADKRRATPARGMSDDAKNRPQLDSAKQAKSRNYSVRSHKPLRASLSDTSTDSSRPSKNSEISSESDIDNSLRSSTSTSINSPEPVSSDKDKKQEIQNGEVLDPALRKAKLELNWSHQSLDQNMSEVASSAAAALSTLMELATPSTATADKKFLFDR